LAAWASSLSSRSSSAAVLGADTMRKIPELQAELMAAYQAFDDARAATHAARVKANELQARETAAADAVADAENQLAAALETESAD
jgi:hypothetical protein